MSKDYDEEDLQRKLIDQLVKSGGELNSAEDGLLHLELSLHLNHDPRHILDALAKLRKMEVVHLDKHREKLYAIFLLPDWERYVSPEMQPVIEPEVDITDPVTMDTMDEDAYFDKMAKALLRQVGQILNAPVAEPAQAEPTVVHAGLSVDDRAKIRNADKIIERLSALNVEHEELKKRHEELKKRNLALAERIDERDMETHRELSTQLQAAKNQIITLVNENSILERSVGALRKQLSRQVASQPGTDPVRKRVTKQEVEDLDNLRRMLEEKPHTGHE